MRTIIDALLIFLYLDAAIFDFVLQGYSLLLVFLIAVGISSLDIILVHMLVSEIFKRLVLGFFGIELHGKGNISSKLAERWRRFNDWDYIAYFVLNLIPFGMFLTTSTALASRFSRRRGLALGSILVGNAVKFMIFIPVYKYVIIG